MLGSFLRVEHKKNRTQNKFQLSQSELNIMSFYFNLPCCFCRFMKQASKVLSKVKFACHLFCVHGKIYIFQQIQIYLVVYSAKNVSVTVHYSCNCLLYILMFVQYLNQINVNQIFLTCNYNPLQVIELINVLKMYKASDVKEFLIYFGIPVVQLVLGLSGCWISDRLIFANIVNI